MANDYYGEIRAKTETSADLYFYGDIVSSWWGAWDEEDQWPEKVRAFLDEIKGAQNLNIYINSGGGSCFAGMAIYNMLSRHKAYKTVYVDGLAASMASIIALCGNRIVIPANAWMMIHQPWSYVVGNADDMLTEAECLLKVEEGMLNTYCANTRPGIRRGEVEAMMKTETWLTGEDAAKYFNVETTPAGTAAAWIDSEHYARYKNMPQSAADQNAPKLPAATTCSTKNDPAVINAAKAKLRLSLSLSRRTS